MLVILGKIGTYPFYDHENPIQTESMILHHNGTFMPQLSLTSSSERPHLLIQDQ